MTDCSTTEVFDYNKKNAEIKVMSKNIILNITGVIILLVGVIGIFNAFYFNRIYDIFWFCYIGMILLGLGIIIRNIPLIKSQMYILLIPDVIWVIDFLVRLLSGRSFLGIVDYFFRETNVLVKIVSLQHVYLLPLVIAAVFLIGKPIRTNNKGVLISVIEITFIYLTTLIFTSPSSNVNCVYRFCSESPWTNPFYPLIWYSAALIMVFMTRAVVNKLLEKLIKDNS
ncbi:hypothetical protein J4447_04470 [Candidatus Pacearchaeota archaeon]|nr:hypothetical protein [Candidatus Pacearchaeota archaeon]